MTPRIPVTIVAGFLGAGKTTLLTSLIKRGHARRLAVLINEFGTVSIDDGIVGRSAEASGETRIHVFSHGLIAYGDDQRFIPTLQAIASHDARVDHVLIETSGLAVPSAAMARLQTAALASDFVLDATLAVVDTPLLLAGEFERRDAAPIAALFAQQLAHADVAVLNKIDELEEAALLAAEKRVRTLAPTLRFVELAHGATLDIGVALGLHLHEPTSDVSGHRHTPRELNAQSGYDGHTHSGVPPHTHGLRTHEHLHEHDPGWLSFVLESHALQDVQRLQSALAAAAEAEPILRAKGLVGTPTQRMLVQSVRGRVSATPDHGYSAPMHSQLVFIGYHLNRARVAALLTKLTGTPWD